ncbi:hypothetical protein PTKIN_Ptkin13bG0122700 [Pterospermum kingtungense]
MATSNERDERRRKIAEKGLNRMSNITAGRVQRSSSSSLPPPLGDDHHHHHPPASQLLHQSSEREGANDERRKERGLNRPTRATAQSNPAILDHHALFSNNHRPPQPYFSGQINAGEVTTSSLNSLDVGGQANLKSQKPETGKDAISASFMGKRGELQPLQGKSSVQKTSTNSESLQKSCRNQPNFFSSKRLNSCIIASERTRGFCALLIAIFVLLSSIDYPLLGMKIGRSESIIASRPLYIILLTDLTVVLGQLFLDKKGDFEEAEEEKEGSQINRQNWKGAVKLLERGLVFYQTIRALFIDCSIYAVVVICGLSLI